MSVVKVEPVYNLHGHNYSKVMFTKYRRGMAWICSVESCKRLHTSKHDKCRLCREIDCIKCRKIKTASANGLCAYCDRKGVNFIDSLSR
jgi:hypothetical protein